MERVSTAAKGLCMWLHAMNVYHKVAKEVGPKREKVAQLTAQLEAHVNAAAGASQELIAAEAHAGGEARPADQVY